MSTASPPPAPSGTEPGEALLDAICRNAARLLEVSAAKPARLRIEVSGTCVEMEWPDTRAAPAADPVPAAAGTAGQAAAPVRDGQADGFSITATTVGTFYHAAGPGEPPFVRVGDEVSGGQQVGILEVMKLMTPVAAERPGRVVEFLVPDGAPVEYGQPLIACALAGAP